MGSMQSYVAFWHNVKYIKGDFRGTGKRIFSVIVIPEWRVDPYSVDIFPGITFRIAHYAVIVPPRIYMSPCRSGEIIQDYRLIADGR